MQWILLKVCQFCLFRAVSGTLSFSLTQSIDLLCKKGEVQRRHVPPLPPPSITFSHVNLPFAKLLGLCPRPHLARFTYLSPNTLPVPYGPTRFSLRESYKWLFPSKVWDLPTALLKTHNFLRKIERTSLNLLELALFLDRSSTNYYKENINFLNFG